MPEHRYDRANRAYSSSENLRIKKALTIVVPLWLLFCKQWQLFIIICLFRYRVHVIPLYLAAIEFLTIYILLSVIL